MGVGAGQPGDVRIAANRNKAFASNRNGLRNAKTIIDRNDFPVRQNDVGRLLLLSAQKR